MTDRTLAVARSTPVRWVDTLDEYARATGELIPVLRPGDATLAASWADVLTGRFAPHSSPPRPDRLVICWETRALDVATVYRDRCAAALAVCHDLDEVVAAASTPGLPTVVVAFADRLTVAALSRINAAAGGPVGFLCGRDAAGLSFAVAKALLSPAPELSEVDVLDAPAHRSADNARRLPADVAAELRRPALVKIIRSHGEGGHAKLGDTVVCGLLGPAEFPAAPDQGCTRSPRSCKRAQPRGAAVVFGTEVAAPVVFFLCCNGFNVAGELYPSPVSMALALAEGMAGAVVAPLRPLVAPDDMLAVLRRSLAEGHPLGAIVRRLNDLSARLGQPNAFVLHGDPSLALPRSRTVPEAPAAEEPLEPVLDWLVRLLRHAGRGHRLLCSARAWLDADRAELVDPLAAQLDRVQRLALDTLKWAEGEPAGDSRARLLRTVTLLRAAAGTWDRMAGRALLEVRDTIDAYDLGHYDQVLAAVDPGEACQRCGTPTERHLFGRGEEASHARVAVLCLVCGPVQEYRVEGLALAAVADGTRDVLRLRARLTVPPGKPALLHGVHLHLRFFDKARDRCVHEESRTVPAENQTVTFRIGLPPGLSPDLHSVRLIATNAFDLAYARVRFAHVPEAASR